METILFLSLFVVASYFSIMGQKNKNFKRFLKAGDSVSFFINSERVYGKVILVLTDDDGNKAVNIIHNNEVYFRSIEDVYPDLLQKYSPNDI